MMHFISKSAGKIITITYFKCNYPAHNLVSTRCQLQLAKDIVRKKDELQWIVRDVMAQV